MIESKHIVIFPNDLGLESNNVVNLIDKPTYPKDLCITFDPSETIKELDGPLYISTKIEDMLWRGLIIDLACVVNVITREYLYTLQLHQVIYDKSDVVIKIFDGFSCPTIGSITLPIEVGTK